MKRIIVIGAVITVVHFVSSFLFIALSTTYDLREGAAWDTFFFPGRWIVPRWLANDSLMLLRPLMIPLTSLFWGVAITVVYFTVSILFNKRFEQE